ncbi:MAG: hypothetical protein VYA69_11705 [Gemmatimonadota bacterium]|nr:hypothetical protein [Gemmatimonadota bacterium]
MIDQELLDILACPETKEGLTVAENNVVDRVNEKIKAGDLKNRGGDGIKEAIDGGLIRDDGKYLYAIRDEIPIMLIDEAIPMEGLHD